MHDPLARGGRHDGVHIGRAVHPLERQAPDLGRGATVMVQAGVLQSVEHGGEALRAFGMAPMLGWLVTAHGRMGEDG
jgi:hypothetical protein